MRQRLSIMFVSAFIAHLLLLHVGMTGYVLCVGDDGHIAIERSLDEETCLDTAPTDCSETTLGHIEALCTVNETHCGNCTDIALLTECDDEKARTPREIRETRVAIPFVMASRELTTENISIPHPPGISSYIFIPSFTAQRNVILLT
ncbi:MAG: hypothetical protein ACRBF0_18285 [Calditrichia bacterium]